MIINYLNGEFVIKFISHELLIVLEYSEEELKDKAQSPIPNPQSPIPNPQSPFELILLYLNFYYKINKCLNLIFNLFI